MPPDLQAKLLRVLQTHEFLRVRDTKPTKTDAHVIAATNRNLEQEARAGHFRSDLYYRLSVFQIELPPLRDRRDLQIRPAFVQKLQQHGWKGNIRELKNVIERAVILADASGLTPDLLPYELQETTLPTDPAALNLETVERQHIQRVLRHAGGNKVEAARLLGIGLDSLYRNVSEMDSQSQARGQRINHVWRPLAATTRRPGALCVKRHTKVQHGLSRKAVR